MAPRSTSRRTSDAPLPEPQLHINGLTPSQVRDIEQPIEDILEALDVDQITITNGGGERLSPDILIQAVRKRA